MTETQGGESALRAKIQGKKYVILARQSNTTHATASTALQASSLRARCDAAGGVHVAHGRGEGHDRQHSGPAGGHRGAPRPKAGARRLLGGRRPARRPAHPLRHCRRLRGRVEVPTPRRRVLFISEDMVLDGEQGELLRAFKYSSAQAFAKDLSYRVSQAQMRSLGGGSQDDDDSIFPWACDKLVRSPAGVPLFRIRDRRDGTQAKLHVETSAVIDVYGTVGGRTGRWRKQKDDRVEWVPGSAAEQALVLDLYRWHYGEGLGSRRIARRLAEQDRQREGGASSGSRRGSPSCSIARCIAGTRSASPRFAACTTGSRTESRGASTAPTRSTSTSARCRSSTARPRRRTGRSTWACATFSRHRRPRAGRGRPRAAPSPTLPDLAAAPRPEEARPGQLEPWIGPPPLRPAPKRRTARFSWACGAGHRASRSGTTG